MTQERFARMLGNSLLTVSRWETGLHNPKRRAIVRRLYSLANRQHRAGSVSIEVKSYFGMYSRYRSTEPRS